MSPPAPVLVSPPAPVLAPLLVVVLVVTPLLVVAPVVVDPGPVVVGPEADVDVDPPVPTSDGS
jgi:hypothetical protein